MNPTKDDRAQFLLALSQAAAGHLPTHMWLYYEYLVQHGEEEGNTRLDRDLFFYCEVFKFKVNCFTSVAAKPTEWCSVDDLPFLPFLNTWAQCPVLSILWFALFIPNTTLLTIQLLSISTDSTQLHYQCYRSCFDLIWSTVFCFTADITVPYCPSLLLLLNQVCDLQRQACSGI